MLFCCNFATTPIRSGVTATSTRSGITATITRSGITATFTCSGITATSTRSGVTATSTRSRTPPRSPAAESPPRPPAAELPPRPSEAGIPPRPLFFKCRPRLVARGPPRTLEEEALPLPESERPPSLNSNREELSGKSPASSSRSSPVKLKSEVRLPFKAYSFSSFLLF